jgi:tetratricopeptide (TPR) repeat protein
MTNARQGGKMKKISVALIIFSLLLMYNLIFAGEGETSAGFLKLGVGARSLAMGGAVTSYTTGVQSLFWNPGGLGWLEGTEALFMHREHFQSIRYENVGFAFGKNTLGFGFSLKGLYLGDIEERIEPSENPLSIMNSYFITPSLSFAKSIEPLFSLGTNIKLIYQQIGEDNASSFAMDAGLSIKSGIEGLRFGCALSDLGSRVQFSNDGYSLPSRIRGGTSYSLFEERINISLDVVKPFREDLEYCFGFEGIIMERFSLRTGYRTGLQNSGNTDNLAGFSAGCGFIIMDLDVDYAFSSYGVLGPAHTFSLSYIFGRTKGVREEEEKRIALELQKRARITAETFYEQGVENEKAGRYEGALKNFDMALIWDPTYADASKHIGTLKKKMTEKEVNDHITKGIAEFKSINYLEAVSEFGLALDIEPENKIAKEWLRSAFEALVRIQMEKIKLKKETMEKITRYFEVGLSHFSKGNYSEAIKEWNKVLMLDPTHTQASDYIAKARNEIKKEVTETLERVDNYITEGKWYFALNEVNRIISFEPDNNEAQERRKKIRKKLTELSKQHAKRGIELFKKGEYNEAATELKIALNFNTKNITADKYLVKIKSRKKTKVSGADVNELYMKGISAYTKENYSIAISYWERVLELDPNHSNAERNIKRAKEKLKVYKK